jgi:hypothetical protein
VSKRLRRERELAFYGDDDFIPSDEYDAEDSEEALQFAEAIVGWVEAGLGEVEPHKASPSRLPVAHVRLNSRSKSLRGRVMNAGRPCGQLPAKSTLSMATSKARIWSGPRLWPTRTAL